MEVYKYIYYFYIHLESITQDNYKQEEFYIIRRKEIPLCPRNLQTAPNPLIAARCIGVSLLVFMASKSAPYADKILSIFKCPFLDALKII